MRREQLARWAAIALLILLAGLAVVSAGRGVYKANQTVCDFEQLWVSGVLVREGLNPYRVFLEDRVLLLEEYARPYNPDWTCSDPLPDRPNYNTPLLSVLMLPLAWASFPAARAIWSGLQVVFAVALPLAMLRLNRRPPGGLWQAGAVLLLLSWAPVRTTFGHGQVALVTSLAAVLAVLLAYRGRPVWAGVLFGLALSKYTLTGALVLFFLVYRHYRVLGVALLTQLAGLLALALLAGETPVQIAQSYARLLGSVIGQSYEIVSLDGWLNVLGLSPAASALAAFAAGALIVGGLVLPRYLPEALGRSERVSAARARLKANLLVVILVLVGLLFTYHRSYDLPVAFVFITFVMSTAPPRTLASRGGRLAAGLLAAALLLNAALIMPPSVPSLFFDVPASLIAAALPVTLALLVVLAASIAALHRLDSLAPLDAALPPDAGPHLTDSRESKVVLGAQRQP